MIKLFLHVPYAFEYIFRILIFKEHFHCDTLIYFELETHTNFINSCQNFINNYLFFAARERENLHINFYTLMYFYTNM